MSILTRTRRRHEVELKFEEIAEQLQSILQRQQDLDKDAKRQHKELQSQLRQAAGGAPVEEGEDDEFNEIVVEVPLWRRCYRLVTGKEGYFIWYSILLMFQMVSIFGLFVEASEDKDASMQSLAGLLGASSIMGLFIAVPALYWRKVFFLNVYMVLQIWTCALAAVFSSFAIQDVYKSYTFCKLEGIGGIPDKNCSLRESRARGKVFYSISTALMAVVVGCVAQSVKDDIVRTDLETMMRNRGGLMALAAGGSTKKSIVTSRNPSIGRIAGASHASQPSWKGKTWQSQKATPSSKQLMQSIGEA